MANIKSNIKTIRKTKKRNLANQVVKTKYKNLIKNARKSNDKVNLSKIYKQIDSAVNKKVITKNKANRIKSRIACYLNKMNNEKNKVTTNIPKKPKVRAKNAKSRIKKATKTKKTTKK
jgi:small subunit ribosomal protein S20